MGFPILKVQEKLPHLELFLKLLGGDAVEFLNVCAEVAVI